MLIMDLCEQDAKIMGNLWRAGPEGDAGARDCL